MEPHADLWSRMWVQKTIWLGCNSSISSQRQPATLHPFQRAKVEDGRNRKTQSSLIMSDVGPCYMWGFHTLSDAGLCYMRGVRILHIVHQRSRAHRMKKPLLSAPKQGRVNCQHATQPPTGVPAGKVGYRVNVNRLFLVFHWLR